VAVALAAVAILLFGFTATQASAATPPIGLGTATSYAVLAGSTITNTGPSVLNGDRGLSPGSDVTGFPPGTLNGAPHTADAEALQAQADLTVAYVDAAGATPATAVATELGGITFTPGTYTGATLGLTGTVTLDAGGDPDAVFLFKTSSTLITASNSSVVLIGAANPCNVYWQVSSSATLGTGTDFVGTVMALTSIAADTGADVEGRLLARNGEVTLDTNVITRPTCAVLPPGTTTTTTAATTTSSTPGSTIATSTTITPSSTTPPSSSIPAATTTTERGTSTSTEPLGSTPGSSTTTTLVGGPTGSGGGGSGGGSGGGTPGTTTGTLARTGSNLRPLAIGGLLTCAAGISILASRRRLTAHS